MATKPKSKSVATDATPAAQLPRYVELVRVSGTAQVKAATPESQRLALDGLRTQRPGVLVERIEALAVSATLPLRETAQGARLIELAQAKAFDELRVHDQDRALSNRADRSGDRMAVMDLLLDAEAILVDATGHVIDPCDDEDYGEFEFFVRSYFAKKELKKILKRTKGGRIRAATEGKLPAGTPPYGRTYDARTKTWGWDQDELATLQQMIKRALDGESCRAIARSLGWGLSSVRRRLRHRHLLGEVKHTGVVMQVTPIINRATWDRLQAAIDGRRSAGRPSTHSPALLQHRAFCECGARMYTRSRKDRCYYVCATAHNGQLRRARCEHASKHHRVAQIDDQVWQAIADFLDQDDTVIRERLVGKRADVSGYEEQLAQCTRKLQALAKAEAAINQRYQRSDCGDDATERWQQALDNIERDRKILAATKQTAERAIAAQQTQQMDPAYLDATIRLLRPMLREHAPPDVRRDVLARLVPDQDAFGVVIRHDGSVELRGAIRLGPTTPSRVSKVSRSSGRTARPPRRRRSA